METQNDLSLVYFKPQIPEIKSYSLNEQKLKTKKFKLQSKHSINQNIQAFGSTRLILVQRVEKSDDGNKSRELLSTSDLKRFRSFVTPTALVESLRIQLLTGGTRTFSSFDAQRSFAQVV
jgi:hypothetical protein